MYSEKSIIARCKKNDKLAYTELFKNYERYLYKISYSYAQNEQDALDIMQEIYIKIYSNMSKFDERMHFLPWVRKIAVNTCLNFKRSLKSNTISLNAKNEDDQCIEDLIAADTDIEDQVEKADFYKLIKDHLDTLSPKQRIVIILRYYEDLSYDEIANILKQPLGTVKTDLYRARNALRAGLRNVMQY